MTTNNHRLKRHSFGAKVFLAMYAVTFIVIVAALTNVINGA